MILADIQKAKDIIFEQTGTMPNKIEMCLANYNKLKKELNTNNFKELLGMKVEIWEDVEII